QFDFAVRIPERNIESRGKAAADRTLPGPHHPHQRHRAAQSRHRKFRLHMLTRHRQRDLHVLAYFRHKAEATFGMRSGQSLGREGMGLVSWFAIILAVLVILSAVGLAIYGG